MLDAPRLRLALACIAAAGLAGCFTPHSKPKLSQAVIDARAHRDAPARPACPQTPLDMVSPVQVGFAFDDAKLGDDIAQPLIAPTQWLACHPGTAVVIRPEADAHGTEAEQNALARARAEAVRDYLSAHGVAAGRIRLLARGQGEPRGEHLLVRAEGRRW